MNITEEYKNLCILYEENINNNNDNFLRLEFNYHNAKILLFFKNNHNFKDTIIIGWNINNYQLIQSFHIDDNKNFFPYIDDNIFKIVKNIVLDENNSVKTFFKTIFSKLVTDDFNIASENQGNITNTHPNLVGNNENYIYFHCLVRSGISKKQAEKIKKHFGKYTYSKLSNLGFNVRFTNDIYKKRHFYDSLKLVSS